MAWQQAAASFGALRMRFSSMFYALNKQERVFLCVGVAFVAVFMTFFAIFHDRILKWMVDMSTGFRHVRFGWLIILLLLFTVSFPPLMGYSAISMFTGMVYGFPWGWPLLAAGTLFGSSLCFVTFRYFFQKRAEKLAQANVKLMAFAKTLEQDKFTLLWLIRLCPLPYSLSNAALSSVHTVHPWNFFLATACTTPKLLLHIFIGDRIARLGAAKDTSSRIVNIFSILLAGGVGIGTTYVIYNRTTARAAEIEAQRAQGRDEDIGISESELHEFEILDSDDTDHADALEEAPSHRPADHSV